MPDHGWPSSSWGTKMVGTLSLQDKTKFPVSLLLLSSQECVKIPAHPPILITDKSWWALWESFIRHMEKHLNEESDRSVVSGKEA